MNKIKFISVCMTIALFSLNHCVWSQGCIDNGQCGPTSYCRKAPGDCDGQGICAAKGDVCIDLWAPVCGCDGNTYSNDCYAGRAGVSVAYGGECQPEICGGFAGIVCTNPDDFCELPAGQCQSADLQGVCMPIPDGCFEIYDPVCGCDGVTYSNDCYRQMAQVAKDHDGPCSNSCQGNSDCSPDAYCAKAEGDCDGSGTCEFKPQACPDVWDPVCGCDGNTYGNRCEAAAVGVNVASAGECPEICGGIAGIPCSDPDEFCDLPAGTCNFADLQGVCTPIPESCILVYDPVCGCDGVTYSNDCFRQMAQVAKDHDGPCSNSCQDNSDCSPDAYCAKAESDCNGAGTCEIKPQGCPDVWDPVCGCDGNTYGNRCEAAAVGVNVASTGECQEICGGFAGIVCTDPGDFCDLPAGQCNAADLQGICTPIPEACPEIYDPVCGCDGVTYDNDCFRQMAQIAKDHDGLCTNGCRDNSDCSPESYCAKAEGDCDSLGTCALRPEICIALWDPVCGCDGKTYGNRCEAAAAGVNVASDGQCQQVCGGLAGIPCPNPDDFCELPDGQCQSADLQGVCVPVPEVCPLVFDPVCGCDGVTYSNDCFRRMAQVAKDHDGPCAECVIKYVSDLNGDCVVNIYDFKIMSTEWLLCGWVPVTACP